MTLVGFGPLHPARPRRLDMRSRLPLALSATALVVALLGSTPLGQAARDTIAAAVPRAKKADFATRAATADNAKKLGGRPAAAYAQLNASGKLPLALLAATPQGVQGPKGAKGDKGDKGDRGPGGLVAAYTKTAGTSGAFTPLTTANTKLVSLSLPPGRYVVFGQATIARDVNGQGAQLFGGCRLSAGDEKSSAVVAGAKAPAPTFAIASTSLIVEFAAIGTAEFGCNDAAFGESAWADARITAIQVASAKKIGSGVVVGKG